MRNNFCWGTLTLGAKVLYPYLVSYLKGVKANTMLAILPYILSNCTALAVKIILQAGCLHFRPFQC